MSGVAREGDLPPQLGIHPGIRDHLKAEIVGFGQEEATAPTSPGSRGPGAGALARPPWGQLALHRYKGGEGDLASRCVGG